MTLDIVLSNRFKKDLRLAKKRGYNLDLLTRLSRRLPRHRFWTRNTATTH